MLLASIVELYNFKTVVCAKLRGKMRLPFSSVLVVWVVWVGVVEGQGGSTLRPPLPPVKVVAAAGLKQTHHRMYTFLGQEEDDNDKFASKDPFDPPSLETIARLMRAGEAPRGRRGSDEGPSGGGGWGRPKPKPTGGWGHHENTRPPTTAGWGRPPPPPTKGWGWSQQDNTTWGPPHPPPPLPPQHHHHQGWTTTRRWEPKQTGGWPGQSREDSWKPQPPPPTPHHHHHHHEEGGGGGGWGRGSYAVVDRAPPPPPPDWDTSSSRSEEHGHGHHPGHHGGGGWPSPTTTRPPYTPNYLSSDEEKYKPIKYPSTPGGGGWGGEGHGDHHHNHGGGHPGNSVWPSSPPPAKPTWPHHNWPERYESSGSGWPAHPAPPPPPPSDSHGGWGQPPPSNHHHHHHEEGGGGGGGWGWSQEEERVERPPSTQPTKTPFEYHPEVDDIQRYLPPDPTFIRIRNDYPPGIDPPKSFEDDDDDKPDSPNHYRLVNYTPTPEERLEILKKLREKSGKKGEFDDDDSPFFDPSKVTEGNKNKTRKEGTGTSSIEDSREKWFIHNFQRGLEKSLSTTTAKSASIIRQETKTTTTTTTTQRPLRVQQSSARTTTTSSTTERPRRNSGGRLVTPPNNNNNVNGASSSGGKPRPRYDSQGFKYIPASSSDSVARKSLGDIYEKAEQVDDFGRIRRGGILSKEKFEEAAASSFSGSLRLKSPGRIALWTGDGPGGGSPGVNRRSSAPKGSPLRVALDKDIGRPRAALLDRTTGANANNVTVVKSTSAPSVSGESQEEKKTGVKNSKCLDKRNTNKSEQSETGVDLCNKGESLESTKGQSSVVVRNSKASTSSKVFSTTTTATPKTSRNVSPEARNSSNKTTPVVVKRRPATNVFNTLNNKNKLVRSTSSNSTKPPTTSSSPPVKVTLKPKSLVAKGLKGRHSSTAKPPGIKSLEELKTFSGSSKRSSSNNKTTNANNGTSFSIAGRVKHQQQQE